MNAPLDLFTTTFVGDPDRSLDGGSHRSCPRGAMYAKGLDKGKALPENTTEKVVREGSLWRNEKKGGRRPP